MTVYPSCVGTYIYIGVSVPNVWGLVCSPTGAGGTQSGCCWRRNDLGE